MLDIGVVFRVLVMRRVCAARFGGPGNGAGRFVRC
jgi:hypothetical protein